MIVNTFIIDTLLRLASMTFIHLRKVLRPVVQLFSNTAWLLSAEMFAKLSRIFTIVVLASALTPVSYGTAMLALAFHDMLALLLKAGVGTQIIRCTPDKLVAYARNGATIQWCICLSLALIQYLSSDYISSLYDKPEMADLLKVMAVMYLFYPWVSIKVFLLHRENRMQWFSVRNGTCVVVENVSIAIFALLGADIMAVAFGKVAFSLLWLIVFSFSPVKSYGFGWDNKILSELIRASGQLFNSELLRALRMHADTFIAGKLMTPELFGLYTFAKNASIGLSQSLGNVFNSALFPFLCKLQRNGTLYQQQRLIYRIATLIGLIFVVQAVMVPIYVPLIFDEKWYSTMPIVTIMCLIALPNIIVDTYCSFQRAKAAYTTETLTRLLCLFINLLMLYIFSPKQPMEFAIVLFFSSLLWCFLIHPGYSLMQKSLRIIQLFIRRKSHEH